MLKMRSYRKCSSIWQNIVKTQMIKLARTVLPDKCQIGRLHSREIIAHLGSHASSSHERWVTNWCPSCANFDLIVKTFSSHHYISSTQPLKICLLRWFYLFCSFFSFFLCTRLLTLRKTNKYTARNAHSKLTVVSILMHSLPYHTPILDGFWNP